MKMKQPQKPQRDVAATEIPPNGRYKTVSVPAWAHADLVELRTLLTEKGASALPTKLRHIVADHVASGSPVLTHGVVFGLACKIAILNITSDDE